VNLLGNNIEKIKNTHKILIDASKEVGLEVNKEETKYMLLSQHQNAGQNHDIKIGNRCFENVAQLRYLGTKVTDQNHEAIKRRLNSGNACCHSAQNLLFSRLLSKKKIRISRTIILPVVLCGCGIWSLTLREEHRPRVFQNKRLRRIFGLKRNEVTGDWGKLHNEKLHNLYSFPSVIRMMTSRIIR
jgi:hypothetical protein